MQPHQYARCDEWPYYQFGENKNHLERIEEVGAYEQGSNPELDEAIRLHDRIVAFLRQDMHISQDYESTRAQLRDLLNQV